MTDCIFCKINAILTPTEFIYKDEEMSAFYDISPKAPVHFMIIPKLHIESMDALTEQHINLIGKMMLKASTLAKEHGLKGYKVKINTGVEGGQEVFHLHIHVLGRSYK
ncbi:MAG: histidine triad family protein [Pseudomonadota bacterium]|nr:histidine triad family protein [Pseudomonadota bacterium]